MRAFAGARGLDLGLDKSGVDMFKSGHQAYGQRLSPYADYEAASAAWDEKAKYSGLSGLLGVYGGNPGSLTPGPKPGDMTSFAMAGALGSDAQQAGRYPGSRYFWTVGNAVNQNKERYGGNAVFGQGNYKAMTSPYVLGAMGGEIPGQLTDAFAEVLGFGEAGWPGALSGAKDGFKN
jgi:hypothetical protein